MPAGLIAAWLLVGLVITSMAGLVRAGGGDVFGALDGLGPILRGMIAGGAIQAALSTLISLLLGAGLALALNRRRAFWGRRLVMALLGAAIAAPVIVIVFGIVAVYGRSGWLGEGLRALHLGDPPSIFGLHGIVLAHVLMNAPFVARALLLALGQQPGERLILASALGFSPWAMVRHVDWPVLRREIPGLALLVFLLCFTSFAVVLTLGGGPGNVTLEVAIFQALRFEADFARAGAIALVQLACCLLLVAALALVNHRPAENAGQGRMVTRPDLTSVWVRRFDGVMIGVAVLLVIPPLLPLLAGFAALPLILNAEVGRAALTSLALALLAACIATALALLLASAARPSATGRGGALPALMDLAALAMLGLPPFAFVAGLYVLLRGAGHPETLGLILVPLVNGLMALPFAYRLIAPPLVLNAERYGRLAASLDMRGINRLKFVDLRVIAAPAAAAFALSMAFSFGDFGVIALFGGGDLVTLPSLLADRLGAYRHVEAGALALVLVLGAGGLAWLADRGRHRHHA